MERILRRTVWIPDTDCLVYDGWRSKDGYCKLGVGSMGERKEKLVHRVMYELLVGPIPEGLEIDHLCGEPSCWNPKHLEPVTRSENVLRSFRRRLDA
jgi:hypothetical protein